MRRGWDYLLVAVTSLALTLPNLGGSSLWDIDEGVNAEAGREMLESGNYVTPTFNFKLRDAKPALLYWLQAASYRLFGVNEFAARLPSALAAMFAGILVYELARRMFERLTGLISAGVLLGSFLVAGAGRFANPDALLLACTCLTMLAFWIRREGNWFVPVGLACGLATMAKGPIGFVLPSAVILVYQAWQGRLRALLDRRVLWGVGALLLVSMPWYAMVTIETRGQFARGFFLTNNVNRFLAPMEDHQGAIFYHALAMIVGFAPWCVFLGPTIWHAVRQSRETDFSQIQAKSATRFLMCWATAYLVFFSLSATKLPGYTLPMYPALAIMTGAFLSRWSRGELQIPAWVLALCLGCLAFVGGAVGGGLAYVSGAVTTANVTFRPIPAMIQWCWLGLLPIAGAATAWRLSQRSQRGAALVAMSALILVFTGATLAIVPALADLHNSPAHLVAASDTRQRGREIRLASYRFTQPSLVFYSQREVRGLQTPEEVQEFLAHPLPSFIFVPEPVWAELNDRRSAIVIARHYDLVRRCDVLVVSNQSESLASK